MDMIAVYRVRKYQLERNECLGVKKVLRMSLEFNETLH